MNAPPDTRQPLRFRTMKTRITLAVLLIVMFVVTALSALGLLYFDKEFRKTIARQQFTLVATVADGIDEKIRDARGELEEIADKIAAGGLVRGEALQTFLEHQPKTGDFFTGRFILTPSGKVAAADDQWTGSRDCAGTAWFAETLRSRLPVVSGALPLPGGTEPQIVFTFPARDDDGEIVAVVCGFFSPRRHHYLSNLAAIRLGADGFLSLYDSSRTPIMHPEPSRLLAPGKTTTDPVLAKGLQGFEGTEETATATGTAVLRSVKPIESAHWVLAASYPLKEAYAPIAKAKRYFVIAALAALLLSAALVWRIMGRVTAPLILLTKHIEGFPVVEGERKPFPITVMDETGRLAEAFDQLLMELDAQRQGLREQVDFLHALMETIPIPVFYKGANGRYLGCNSAFESLLGRFRESIVGRLPQDVLPVEWTERREEADLETLLRQGGAVYEESLVSEDGISRDVIFYMSAYVGADGKPAGVVGAIIDISAQLRSERALRRSEERYLALFEGVGDIIYSFSRSGTIIALNAAFERVTGWARDEWLGRRIDDLVHPDDRGAIDRIIRSSPEERRIPVEVQVRTKTGDYVTLELRSTLHGTEGSVTSIQGIARDLTDRKKSEEEKRLLEHQLRQSQKMEAIGTLAGGVAHDFNNILTAVVGYSTILERKLGEDHPLRHYVDKILASADKAAGLTRSLLAYSRKEPINPAVLDVNSIVSKADTLLSRLLGEDIEVEVVTSAEPLMIMADSLQIEQVLMNLVANARDAMPDGGSLRIRVLREEMAEDFIRHHGFGKPGAYAVLEVADSGSGMSAETKERIFEPFFTTKGVGKGTGLGLSIVFGIVKQHGGYVDVESSPGEGTTFSIYLPLTSAEPAEPVSPPSGQGGSGHETILLIEDEREIREALKELLEHHGYTVIDAPDGEQGLREFRKRRDEIPLVVMDVVIPGLGARELHAEMLRVRPNLKTIFISGYTEEIVDAKGISAADVNFIPKPIVIDALLAKIREVLDRPEGAPLAEGTEGREAGEDGDSGVSLS